MSNIHDAMLEYPLWFIGGLIAFVLLFLFLFLHARAKMDSYKDKYDELMMEKYNLESSCKNCKAPWHVCDMCEPRLVPKKEETEFQNWYTAMEKAIEKGRVIIIDDGGVKDAG